MMIIQENPMDNVYADLINAAFDFTDEPHLVLRKNMVHYSRLGLY